MNGTLTDDTCSRFLYSVAATPTWQANEHRNGEQEYFEVDGEIDEFNRYGRMVISYYTDGSIGLGSYGFHHNIHP